jgi:hypothetical protein
MQFERQDLPRNSITIGVVAEMINGTDPVTIAVVIDRLVPWGEWLQA